MCKYSNLDVCGLVVGDLARNDATHYMFVCLCVLVFCLPVGLCAMRMLGAHGGQKTISDHLDVFEPTWGGGCWELNPSPLKEQQVLLTIE